MKDIKFTLGEVADIATLLEEHVIYEQSNAEEGGAMFKSNMELLQERVDKLLAKNLELLHGFVAPVVEDRDMPELSALCMNLSMDAVKEYASNAGKELEKVHLENMFKRYHKELMDEFLPTVVNHELKMEDIQDRISRRNMGEEIRLDRPKRSSDDGRIVTLFNVVETIQTPDGRIAIKEHKKLVTTRGEFVRMINSESIRGVVNTKTKQSFGRIYGFTDVRELELDDFSHGDSYMIEHAPGIHEIITEIEFLEAITYEMGNAEIIRYKADNEIRYGRSQELFMDQDDTEDVASFINMNTLDEEAVRKDIYQYGFREDSEKRYHYNQIKERFERHFYQMRLIYQIGAKRYCDLLEQGIFKEEFTTNRDLVELCAGKLFGGYVTIYDGNMKKKDIKKDVWTLPWNAMTQEQRQELLEMYHEIKEDIAKRLRAKQKVRAKKYESVIEKIKEGLPVTKTEVAGALEYAEAEKKLNNRTIFTPTVYAGMKAMIKQ